MSFTPGTPPDPDQAPPLRRRRPRFRPPLARADESRPDNTAGRVRLKVRDVTGEHTEIITHTPYTIGRRETNDLRLSGTEVSRQHAEIARDGDTYTLRDRGSSYGTFVNDAPVSEHALQPGDRIRLGRGGGADIVFGAETSDSLSSRSGTDPISAIHMLGALLEALRALGPGRVLNEVLGVVLDSAIDLSGAERGCIMLPSHDGTLDFTLKRARGRTTIVDETFEASRKFPEEAFATGETLVVRDLPDEEVADLHLDTIEIGIRHVLCVPLRVARFGEAAHPGACDRCIGVLYLDGRKAGTLLSDTVRSCLDALATEAAVAIENARLYRESAEKARMDQEMRLAIDIQRMLLPRLAIDLPFVEAAAASLPCRSVGGDFFDYFVREEGCLAFTLGDVAGKGPSAALLSALMQGMLSIAAPGCSAPASVVSRVNEALYRRGIEARFATLFHGALDSDGQFAYCNGGHNPPFVFGPSGVRRLYEGGPIVGAFDGVTYREGVVTLAPGDRIVLFSDGVSEALDRRGEEFGDARILEVLESGRAESADMDATDFVEALLAAVLDYARGAPQSDDITAMVIRYRGAGR